MMNRRERVLAALHFEKTDFTPYQIGFTGQMYEKMKAYAGEAFFGQIRNHLVQTDLGKPQITVGPELSRDEYGVVWNKSGADKDIGVIDAIRLRDPADLASFELPPVDEAFVRGKWRNSWRSRTTVSALRGSGSLSLNGHGRCAGWKTSSAI